MGRDLVDLWHLRQQVEDLLILLDRRVLRTRQPDLAIVHEVRVERHRGVGRESREQRHDALQPRRRQALANGVG